MNKNQLKQIIEYYPRTLKEILLFKPRKIREQYVINVWGDRVGPSLEYHYNGLLSCNCCFSRTGKLDGLCETYWITGEINTRCTYKDGKVDGVAEAFNTDGRTCLKCLYKDGKKNGIFETYYENGQLEQKCRYKDGKLDGVYEKYDTDGKLTRKDLYRDDLLESKEARFGLNLRLEELSRTMKPSIQRQLLKRKLVKDYRGKRESDAKKRKLEHQKLYGWLENDF